MVRKTSSRATSRQPRAAGPKAAQTAHDPGASSDAPDFDADAAQARIDAGESIDSVAQSFGKTARGLRNCLTRAASRRDRLGSARDSLGLETAPEPTQNAPVSAAGAAPAEGTPERQLTPEEEQALKDFARFCTPRVIVDTVDGFQSSLVSGICYLANVELTDRQREMIPFEEAEKKGLEPWAAFATAGIGEEIRKDPSLGLKAFIVILGLTLTRRAVLVAAVIKSQKARQNMKHAPKTQSHATPETPVSVDEGATAS